MLEDALLEVAQEDKYGKTEIANAGEILRVLRGEVDAEAFEEWIRRAVIFLQSKKVLLSWLHGEDEDGELQTKKRESGEGTSEENHAVIALRGMWEEWQDASTPHRRKPAEQLAGELDKTLLELSRETASVEKFMRCVWEATKGEGFMPESLQPNEERKEKGATLYEPASLLEENWQESEVKNALRANASKSSHAIIQPVIALQANGIDRADTAGCNGCGWRENESYTLTAIDRHAVCYDARGNGGGETVLFEPRSPDGEPRVYGDICPTLNTAQGGQRQPCIAQETYQAKTGPLMANSHPGSYTGQDAYSDMLVAGKAPKPPRKYIIRRLTPTECARLQGFPDWWSALAPYNPADAEFWEEVRKTYAEINGKKYKPVKDIKKWYDKLYTDSAEYKMWGNGIALPNAEYVIRGIAEQGAKTLGSLFDGSGGFPLAGVMNGIKPLWASEVEPYPIAVTKSRFEGV